MELHPHIKHRGTLSNVVLGFSDGMIVTLAFLTGISLNFNNVSLVILAGVAAIAADAISMFFSVYLSSRTEADLFDADYRRELYEIENEPEEEREELIGLYLGKGLDREEADSVVSKIMKDKAKWLEEMLLNELHEHKASLGKPLRSGLINGVSCLFGGTVPLVPYLVVRIPLATVLSVVASLVVLFVLGAVKARNSDGRVFLSGAEMMGIGAVASLAVYIVGRLLLFV